MKNLDFIRERLLNSADVSKNTITDSIQSLRISEWSPKFERLMRVRLIMGAFRYGKLNSSGKACYDRLNAINMHVIAYLKDGNDEHLVDIANLSLCEFVEGTHPKKHFEAVDDGEHAKIVSS